MSNEHTISHGLPRRPPHVHVASLGTNASGIAASIAGSEWSGISQFPSPPSDIPTPTIGTPTSYHFTERFAPSIPNYQTPNRFQFGTPPTPRSPANSQFSGSSHGQDARSLQSVGSAATVHRPLGPLDIPNDRPKVQQSPSSSSTSPLSCHNVRALAIQTDHSAQKRPETPHSVAAPSSLLDWSDATSGISINPSEERLLRTSFITSLLSQSPEPFPSERLANARDHLAQRLGSEATTPISREGGVVQASSPQRIIPPFYPSDLVGADGREATDGRRTAANDRRSRRLDSRRASKDYAETLHSDEQQVQSGVGRPSMSIARGGIEAHPVAVVPALRIPLGPHDGTNNSFVTLNNSVITSTSMASNPPVHRADAPQNVRFTSGFDGDGGSEEDFVKLGGADLLERPSISESTPHQAQNRFTDPVSKSGSKFTLQRNQSMKSVVSSLVSRISNNSAARKSKYLARMRNRPLPPLPIGGNRPPEFPNGKEIQQLEEDIPLPTLAKRAEHLTGMLSRGRFPAGSGNEFYYKETSGDPVALQANDHDTYVQIERRAINGGNDGSSLFQRFRGRKEDRQGPSILSPSAAKISLFDAKRKRRRRWAIAVCVVVGVVLVTAIPVALSQRKDDPMPICNGNQTGAACTLDATCVCTSNSGSCKPLARSLSLLVSDVNDLFSASFTAEGLSDAVVAAVGDFQTGLCFEQALLLDVEPGLNSAAAPNRTKWAQAAILWNLGMSEDISATTTLQKFVSTAPWDNLPSSDGPVDDGDRTFARDVSGFTFDFASQTVTPLSASFKQSSPSDQQLAEMSEAAEGILDRMYSYAIASSTQREKALVNYWTSVLQRQESELQTFIDAVQNSPFLIPFDAASSPGGKPLAGLMINSSSTQFPVPISCYPGLNSAQLASINTLESHVFNLYTVLSSSDFVQSCFSDRPVYGAVNLLGLRLPFPDSRKGVALQGCSLSKDAKVRAVVYSGEVLSALPGGTPPSDTTSSTLDPRQFGTTGFLSHVLLNYFSSISNTSLAMDLVSHVLSSGIPANNSDLANSLSSLPVLEFAVFGSIRPQDIGSCVSSFSTPTGSLFFGSDAGHAFRSWALLNSASTIAWAESALSSEVVRDTSSTDDQIESVWKPASELVASGSTDQSDVQKVTSSLRSLGLFSS